MLRIGPALFLLIAGMLTQIRAGQDGSAPQRTPEFRVRVNLVSFDVEVLDHEGNQVTGLRREDFRVREDGQPKEIVNFSWLRDRAVSLAAVVDTSGLPREQLVVARRFVSLLAHVLDRGDEVALLTYDRRDAYLETDFTRDRGVLQEALDNVDTVGGRGRSLVRSLFGAPPRTALALDLALLRLRERQREKKAALVISNGFRGLGPATVEHVQEAGYTILTLSFSSKTSFLVTLGGDAISKRQILRESGGRDFGGSADDLVTPAHAMARALKNFYSLGYLTSEGSGKKRRNVEITVPGGNLRVYYRRSFAPKD